MISVLGCSRCSLRCQGLVPCDSGWVRREFRGEASCRERGRCGCPRLVLPGMGDAGGDMSEEEEGAKGCRFAFSAEVVIYAECVHICVHVVCMDWLSAWVR